MQMWILIRQFSPGSLCPDHERIHRSLDVRFALQGSVASHWHRDQGPVVSLQDLRDRVPDAGWEALIILGVQLLAQTAEQGSMTVGARWWGRCVGVRFILRHGAVCPGWTTRLVVDRLVVLLCHFEHNSIKWKSKTVLYELQIKGTAQQVSRCAFYARCALLNSLNGFSVPETLFVFHQFVCLVFPKLPLVLQSSKLRFTIWAEELQVTATWVWLENTLLHLPPGIGWSKSPPTPHWLRKLCGVIIVILFFFIVSYGCPEAARNVINYLMLWYNNIKYMHLEMGFLNA